MLTRLAYGKTGIDLELDDAWDIRVLEPRFITAVADPVQAIREALNHPIGSLPLCDRVQGNDTVGIVFNDITRATPNQLILPAILEQLTHVPRRNITLFDALGTHRANTPAELRGMLGDLVDNYRVVQNNCLDQSTQTRLGCTSRGHEIWINSAFTECSFKILTGFIEPHFFAGFSGGGKAVMPGMAGLETILGNHSPRHISQPGATWGITRGNPIWEEVREVARRVGSTFLVNVTLNRDKEVTAVFAGDLDAAHAAGCAYARETAMVSVAEPFDIVVTSNSGYPLDLNLYQAVKGMSAAAQVVRQGGAILIAAECWDGIPEHGSFGRLLRESDGPQELLEKINSPGFSQQDMWQAQILAQILLKADVYVYSGNLSHEQIERAMLRPAAGLGETLAQLVSQMGPSARIGVLPEGPLTIPYILAGNPLIV